MKEIINERYMWTCEINTITWQKWRRKVFGRMKKIWSSSNEKEPPRRKESKEKNDKIECR